MEKVDTEAEQVIFSRYPMTTGGSLLHISLNNPKSLNALNLPMVRSLKTILDSAVTDDDVKLIFLDAVGDRAFCAGGDIVSMYKAMAASTELAPSTSLNMLEHAPAFLLDFFTEEYTLDHAIHTCPKPIIAWGNGVIMGGGMGLHSGASYRVVTETTRMAMPELVIGLVPDVGASYFLNTLPAGIGLLLGLTGAKLNGNDAVQTGLADVCIAHAHKQAVLDALADLPEITSEQIEAVLAGFKDSTEHPAPSMQWSQIDLSELAQATDAESAQRALSAFAEQNKETALLQKGVTAMHHGSPLATKLFFEQLLRGKNLSLADCFKMELSLALSSVCSGELKEGIRALLIDKDNTPKWKYAGIEQVPNDYVDSQFEYFAQRGLENTLSTLGD